TTLFRSGAMQSGEEIDAIRTLGLDPIELLVLPRLFALLVMLPLLTFLAMIAGIAGGLAVSVASLGFTPEMFLTRLHETMEIRHFWVGLSKAPVFATVIALIGCLEGFQVQGTAQSVGERTTSSVVQTISLVILIDAFAAMFSREMAWWASTRTWPSACSAWATPSAARSCTTTSTWTCAAARPSAWWAARAPARRC